MSAGLSALLLGYLELSLVVFVAWLGFAMFARISTFRNERVAPADLVRVGRILITAALLSPVVATIVLVRVPEPVSGLESINRTRQQVSVGSADPSRDTAPTLQSMRLLIGRQDRKDLESAGIVIGAALAAYVYVSRTRCMFPFPRWCRVRQISFYRLPC
jgi:hypothetical protein